MSGWRTLLYFGEHIAEHVGRVFWVLFCIFTAENIRRVSMLELVLALMVQSGWGIVVGYRAYPGREENEKRKSIYGWKQIHNIYIKNRSIRHGFHQRNEIKGVAIHPFPIFGTNSVLEE
jgi:hypothetical protein